MSGFILKNVKIWNKKEFVLGSLQVEGSLITAMGESGDWNASLPSYDGNQSLVLPSFINMHDHLLASYLPKVGGENKHISWLSFDNLYKSSAVFAERQQIDAELLYYLGAYKNLFSGVSMVFDHIPTHISKPFSETLPTKLVNNYYLAHSIGNYSLNWGEGAALEYKLAEENNRPFITHLGEGIDEESIVSLRRLEKMNALGPNSVLVHCLPFGQREVDIIAKNKATVVWCPSSNIHIFGKTTNIKLFLDSGVNVCLGTDFSPSGSLHLLEEIRFAKEIFEKLYDAELSDETILQWITQNAANAIRDPKVGQLSPGKTADFILISSTAEAEENFLSKLTTSSIDLMVIDGNPSWGSPLYEKIFTEMRTNFERIIWKDQDKIVAGSPVSLLNQVSASLGYKKELAFLPVSEK
ncbi:amidohydrolase [Leptospira ryugenii]|uniref:Amidohydrolase n=1 Tax=Leptospira ryugenii TaxID=1917863 RepID=A0A2P2DVC9_9LEPT|nr:amidohydrolase family protein [Leptospira ryugenii]GBF48596.1 amidohydrolase [Leptospira ryugenii]